MLPDEQVSYQNNSSILNFLHQNPNPRQFILIFCIFLIRRQLILFNRFRKKFQVLIFHICKHHPVRTALAVIHFPQPIEIISMQYIHPSGHLFRLNNQSPSYRPYFSSACHISLYYSQFR